MINHEHDENCCHDHDHHHDGECGCGHHGHSHDEVITLSDNELSFLASLTQTAYLPIAKFVMMSSESDDVQSVALAPVYMKIGSETMEEVKATAQMLLTLEEYGLVDLDYDTAPQNDDYIVIANSDLYAYLGQTIEEGKNRVGFLFNMPALEYGRVVLTALGYEVAEKLRK